MSTGNTFENPKQSSSSSNQQSFQSHDIGIRMQKKLLGRMMSNKTMAKTLIDSDSARLMDNLHRLCKLYCRQEDLSASKETADKVVKYLMKITIKIAILIMNHQFDNDEMFQVTKIQRSIRSILMTIVSFHEVDFSYDRQYLQKQMQTCNVELQQLIRTHLSDKSQRRIDFVFQFLGRSEFLDRFFTTTDPTDEIWFELKASIVKDINHLLESKNW